MSRVLPILFNTEMVWAILDDRKKATRRLVMPHNRKKAKEQGYCQGYGLGIDFNIDNLDGEGHIKDYSISDCWMRTSIYIQKYAQYRPGDILYVRETWCNANKEGVEPDYYYFADTRICEDYNPAEWKWRPSIHMPKDAARIWLMVTDVRVERLQDMTLDDFLNEGVVIRPEAFNDPENAYQQAKNAFINIWDATVKKTDIACYGWDADPYVLAIEFERCEKPDSSIVSEGDGRA